MDVYSSVGVMGIPSSSIAFSILNATRKEAIVILIYRMCQYTKRRGTASIVKHQVLSQVSSRANTARLSR